MGGSEPWERSWSKMASIWNQLLPVYFVVVVVFLKSQCQYDNRYLPSSLKISCVVEYGYSTEIPFPRHRNERKKDTLWVINTPLAELIVVSHHQWESEFRENTVQRIRNPTNDWNPESKFHCLRIWNLVPGIRNPPRKIQNARLSWIFLS